MFLIRLFIFAQIFQLFYIFFSSVVYKHRKHIVVIRCVQLFFFLISFLVSNSFRLMRFVSICAMMAPNRFFSFALSERSKTQRKRYAKTNLLIKSVVLLLLLLLFHLISLSHSSTVITNFTNNSDEKQISKRIIFSQIALLLF